MTNLYQIIAFSTRNSCHVVGCVDVDAGLWKQIRQKHSYCQQEYKEKSNDFLRIHVIGIMYMILSH